MKTYTYSHTELAESYINGNISFVRKCLNNGTPIDTLTVRKRVAELAGEEKAKMFSKSMGEI